jgi:hypothetical protein
MKILPILITLLSLEAWAGDYGWKCPDGTITAGVTKSCVGGVKLHLDDMNAAQLNAYTKALSVQDRKDAAARQAEDAQRRAQDDAKDAALLKLCGKLDGEPVIGMTEEQFVKCTMFGEPATKNYTVTSNGKMVQYVYRSPVWHGFAYFRNGRLTSYQF